MTQTLEKIFNHLSQIIKDDMATKLDTTYEEDNNAIKVNMKHLTSQMIITFEPETREHANQLKIIMRTENTWNRDGRKISGIAKQITVHEQSNEEQIKGYLTTIASFCESSFDAGPGLKNKIATFNPE